MTGTLKARVGGAWVPVLGSGADAANTARWNSAWGTVASSVLTTDVAVPVAGATLLSTTFTAVAGRTYAVRASGVAAVTAGNTLTLFRVQTSAVWLGEDRYTPNAGSSDQLGFRVNVENWQPAAGSITVSLLVYPYAQPMTVTGTWSPTRLTVVDTGPVTPASIAPPTAGPSVVASGNALGIVAVGATTNFGGTAVAANTPTDVTLPLTFTSTVGRRYRLVCRMRATTSTSGTAYLRPSVDGNSMGDYYRYVSGAYDAQDVEAVFDGTGTTSVYKVVYSCSVAGTVFNETAFPVSGFYIEDVGPNTAPALPIPATPPAWTAVALTGGWSVSAPETVAYRKIGDVVTLRGAMIRAAGDFNGTVAFTLPAGFRPPYQIRCAQGLFQAAVGGSFVVRCGPDASGVFVLNEPSTGWNNAWGPVVSLANISFSTTP